MQDAVVVEVVDGRNYLQGFEKLCWLWLILYTEGCVNCAPDKQTTCFFIISAAADIDSKSVDFDQAWESGREG